MRERCPGCWGGCCSPRDRREAGVRLRAGSQNGLRSGGVKRSAVPSTCGRGSRQAAGVRVKNLGFCAFFFFFFPPSSVTHRALRPAPQAGVSQPSRGRGWGSGVPAATCSPPVLAPPPPRARGGSGVLRQPNFGVGISCVCAAQRMISRLGC